MKKILISILLLAGLTAKSQVDTKIGMAADRNAVGYKVTGAPAWQIDNIRNIVMGPDTFKVIRGGEYIIANLGIYSNGSNMLSKLQSALDNPLLSSLTVVGDTLQAPSVIGSLNAHGKTLKFVSGNRFSGAVALDSAFVDAYSDNKIFDSSATFTNLKTRDGAFYPKWIGAPSDTVNNARRFLYRAAVAAASNNLTLVSPAGMMYIDGELSLPSNTKWVCQPGNYFKIKHGSQINNGNVAASNITVDGIYVSMSTAAYSNTMLFNFTTSTGRSSNINLLNLTVFANRFGYWTVHLSGIDRFLVSGFKIYESNSTSLMIENCTDGLAKDGYIKNAGRGGVSVYRTCRNVRVEKTSVYGWSQYEDLTDAAFDMYGDDNEFIYFEHNFADSDTSTYLGNKNHIGIRQQGGRNCGISYNQLYMRSLHMLNAIRSGNRNDYYSQNITIDHNKIYVKGNYGMIIGFQGNRNPDAPNNEIIIDSAASPEGEPYAFFVQGSTTTDTLDFCNFSHTKVNANGKLLYHFGNRNAVKYVNFDGTIWLNGNNANRPNTPSNAYDTVGVYSWIGGMINNKDATNYVFRLGSNTGFYLLKNITIFKPDNNIIIRSTAPNAKIINSENIVNGVRGTQIGGELRATSATVTTSTFTLLDSLAAAYCNYTGGNMVFTLTQYSYNTNRLIFVKNIRTSGSNYVRFVNVADGADTLYRGESSWYHWDGAAWHGFGKSGTSSGGSTIDSSRVADIVQTVLNSKDSILIKNKVGLGDSLATVAGGALEINRVGTINGEHIVGATNLVIAKVDTVYFNATNDSLIYTKGGIRYAKKLPGGNTAISALTAAVATLSIDNLNYTQSLRWNTLASVAGLNITSTSTLAAANGQKLFRVDLSGANANSSQTTIAAEINNSHTGTSPQNHSLVATTTSTGINSTAGYFKGVGNQVIPIRIQNTTTSGYSYIQFMKSDSTLMGAAGYANSSASLYAGKMILAGVDTVDVGLGTNGIIRVLVDDVTGYVRLLYSPILTTAPTYLLADSAGIVSKVLASDYGSRSRLSPKGAISNTANVASSSVSEFMYTLSDTLVQVTTKIVVTPSGTGTTSLGISFPTTAALSIAAGCWGMAAIDDGSTVRTVIVNPDEVHSLAAIAWNAVNTNAHVIVLNYTYRRK